MAKSTPPPFHMMIEGGRLVPASPFDAERLDSYRNGTKVKVQITDEKDRPLIRKWWAILGMAIKQCETPWQTKDQASEAIKLALGYVTPFKTINGQWGYTPIHLTELSDREMEEIFEQMMGLLHKITGVDPETLRKEAPHTGADQWPPEEPGDDDETQQSGAEEMPTEPAPTEEGVNPPSTPSSETPSGRAVLIRYARDVIWKAIGRNKVPAETMNKIVKTWAHDITKLDEADKEIAREITIGMKAIFLDEGRADEIIEKLAGQIGCQIEDLSSRAA
jgi:hypothetical protein